MNPQEASSSSRCAYHVFLSFRGKDTRKNFTDHLYTALAGAGIHTFRDDDELERGENVDLELQKAIRESKVSLIVFSKDYASSKWCLDELVRILERRANGHKVLPVFYDVDPSVVENQRGSFGESFSRLEEKFRAEAEVKREEGLKRMHTWKAALKEVANLGGMVLENLDDGHEAKFIQRIVKEIEKKLKRKVLNVALYPVGIESRVQRISLWLQDNSTDVEIGVICGLGGIGKTTISKVAYNLNFEQFEGSCFLANIRETSEKPDGLVHLQRQFLSDITNGKLKKIHNVDEGIIKIKDAVNCKRVLIVLDDVDQVEQLDALIGIQDMFFQGSKIVITTRHEQLLKSQGVHKTFKITELNDDESLQLFSWHAFGQVHPPESHLDHSRSVIEHCGGLPLAIKVLGSSLSGRKIEVWKSSLNKLQAVLHNKIRKMLEVSYKSLDDHDKSLFLHIASSYVGKDRDEVVKILEESEFFTAVGIQNLIDRGLLTIGNDNKLLMHQLLQDMGKEIIRQESINQIFKHTGLLQDRDSLSTLTETAGGKGVEAVQLLEKDNKKVLNVESKKRRHPDSDELSVESMLRDQGNSLKRRIYGFFSTFYLTKLFDGKRKYTS